jgi:hypothetical protein
MTIKICVGHAFELDREENRREPVLSKTEDAFFCCRTKMQIEQIVKVKVCKCGGERITKGQKVAHCAHCGRTIDLQQKTRAEVLL